MKLKYFENRAGVEGYYRVFSPGWSGASDDDLTANAEVSFYYWPRGWVDPVGNPEPYAALNLGDAPYIEWGADDVPNLVAAEALADEAYAIYKREKINEGTNLN